MSLPIRITYNINAGPDQVQLLNGGASANVAVGTAVPGSYVYSITSVRFQAAPTCNNVLGTPITTTVVVRPTPTASISGTTSVCRNAPSPNITFTNPQSLTERITYNINGGSNTTIDVNAGSTNTVAAPTGTAGTFTYNLVSVIYTAAPACSNAISGSATVTVNPLPVPTITGPAAVCLNSTGNVYTTEPGMTGYVWTVSAGGSVTSGGTATDNTVTVTWNTTGAQTVRVNYTNANSCTAASATVYNVQVGDPPTGATITGSTVCIGSASTIRVTITGGAPNYTITIPEYSAIPIAGYVSGTDINVGVLALGAHTYTLSSAQDACGNPVPGLPKTATATVNPNNTVSAASSTPTLCISTPLTAITHTTTGATGIGAASGLPAGVTAAWAGNTITISGTPTASGVFNYSIPLNWRMRNC